MTDRRDVAAGIGLLGLTGLASCAPKSASRLTGTNTMPKITPNYMEMKATDLGASKAFYEKAFDFAFTDYGPEYAAVEGGPVQIGLATGEEPPAPMPTFESDDLEAALAKVKAADGEIVKEIFAYPGGRRFECLDPSGNRLAIYQVA
ncbi:VOC family protein [Parasphingorhabdus sp.]